MRDHFDCDADDYDVADLDVADHADQDTPSWVEVAEDPYRPIGRAAVRRNAECAVSGWGPKLRPSELQAAGVTDRHLAAWGLSWAAVTGASPQSAGPDKVLGPAAA